MLRDWMQVLFLLMLAPVTLHAEDKPSDVPGEKVVLTTAYGTHFNGYVNGPANAKRGVLILHDRYGFNAEVEHWADRFADMGYRALAVDLFDGRRATNLKRATEIRNSVDQAAVSADVAAAVKYLTAPGRKVVVLGWDYGGQQALLATLRSPAAISATIIYYGNVITDQVAIQTIVNPVLVVRAEHDEELSLDSLTALKDGLSKVRVKFNIMGLDAGRGFFNPLSPHYDGQAAEIAWETTKNFLDERLGK